MMIILSNWSISHFSLFQSSCNFKKSDQKVNYQRIARGTWRRKKLNQSFVFYSWIFSRFILFKTDTARFFFPSRKAFGHWLLSFFSQKCLSIIVLEFEFFLCYVLLACRTYTTLFSNIDCILLCLKQPTNFKK